MSSFHGGRLYNEQRQTLPWAGAVEAVDALRLGLVTLIGVWPFAGA